MLSFLLFAAKALLATLLFTENAAGDSATQKPNILFFISDDQDLHMNSLNFMPNLKTELSDKGATFEKHYCTTALCCPSRTSLLSGQCVHNTNVTDVSVPFGAYPKFVTQGYNDNYLPIWLQDGGIKTYYVGKFLNGHSTKNYRDPAVKGWTSSNFLLEPGVYDYENTTWSYNNEDYQSFPGINSIDLTSKNALEMLDTAVNGGGPWFLTIAPAVPHVGINASVGGSFVPIPQKKWADAFPNEIIPRTPNFNPEDQDSGASWILNMPHLNQSTISTFDEFYRARIRCVAGLDDIVADLVAALDKYGVLDNTHIIYTSDNGYHIGQHRLGGGKKTGFETDVNVPMIWRGPGIPSGKTVNTVSTHTDLAPTFLSIFGLGLRTHFDGQIIAGGQGGAPKPGEHINIEHWGSANPYEILAPQPLGEKIPGAANSTYKGLRINGDGYGFFYTVWCTNEHELYDMVADQYQTTNILPNTYDITGLPAKEVTDWPLDQVVQRLDALMMVLKSCVGIQCTKPWLQLHPLGDVDTLKDAMSTKYDTFYASQTKVSFSACKQGYILEFEGPQTAMTYVS